MQASALLKHVKWPITQCSQQLSCFSACMQLHAQQCMLQQATAGTLAALHVIHPRLLLLLLLLHLCLQETADGELVVLHDFDLLRAFPNTGPNIAAYQQLAQHGIKPPPTSVQVKVGAARL